MTESLQPYPGDDATAADVLRLADAWRDAALALIAAGGADPLARAPGRFCAMHAIELYLCAYLRARGEPADRLRGQGHNFTARSACACDHGLRLREKTAEHLRRLTTDREYLVTRYGPERVASVSEMNRLTATLEEIAHKVRQAFGDAAPRAVGSRSGVPRRNPSTGQYDSPRRCAGAAPG